MIIKNISEIEKVSFILHLTKVEYVTIEPGKYIYIDESSFTSDFLGTFTSGLEKDYNIEIEGDRKNYKIGTEPPKKEEFVNRFEIMDIEE